MSEEVNLNDTFDAKVWAQEWLKTIENHPSVPTNEGSMIGWFANAIMAGYDHHDRITPSASEVLYRFAAWLTTREEEVTISSRHDAGIVAELVSRFCEMNELPEPWTFPPFGTG